MAFARWPAGRAKGCQISFHVPLKPPSLFKPRFRLGIPGEATATFPRQPEGMGRQAKTAGGSCDESPETSTFPSRG